MSLTDKIRSIFSGQAHSPLPELPSIYEHISAHLSADAPGLREGGHHLPDEAHVRGPSGMESPPGARDGISARRAPPASAEPNAERVSLLHRALCRLADRPGQRARAEVLGFFHAGDARLLLGPLLSRLEASPPRNQRRLYDEMRQIVLQTGHREVLKYAMMIVAAFGNEIDMKLFVALGRHEEFTFYAALAVSNLLEDPRSTWLDMARRATGWGRIELTELLLDAEQPEAEVSGFFLREGASNDIAGSYTALTIATKCQLHEALAIERPDGQLLVGGGEILAALAAEARAGEGGAGADMFSYPEGGRATELLLQHWEPRVGTLEDFLTIDRLRSFATNNWEPDALRACGWTPQRTERILAFCQRILDAPAWADVAQVGLNSRDPLVLRRALAVAKSLGLPVRDHLKRRIEKEPLCDLWGELARGANEQELDEVLEMATHLLDLDAIATGPAREPGHGPGYRLHRCAHALLRELRHFPGKGWEVIRPALRSPLVRNRHAALDALAAWSGSALTDEVRRALERGADDPDEALRSKAHRILASARE